MRVSWFQGVPDGCQNAIPRDTLQILQRTVVPGPGYLMTRHGPCVLPLVREAEQCVLGQNLDKEYAGITGTPALTKATVFLAYGITSASLNRNKNEKTFQYDTRMSSDKSCGKREF